MLDDFQGKVPRSLPGSSPLTAFAGPVAAVAVGLDFKFEARIKA
jgi:hypothetical protein